jgi:hypothetical protein
MSHKKFFAVNSRRTFLPLNNMDQINIINSDESQSLDGKIEGMARGQHTGIMVCQAKFQGIFL